LTKEIPLNLYDIQVHLTATYFKQSGGAVTNSHAYTYNYGNQRVTQTRTDGRYVTYYYDDAGQIYAARATNSLGAEITGEKFGYRYDAAWNLVTKTNTGITCTLNNLNEITSDGGLTYSSDGNGNLTGFSSSSFIYDDENQLTSEYFNYAGPGWGTQLVYDGKMRLRSRSENSWNGTGWSFTSLTTYVYDGMTVVQERSYVNTPAVTYTRGTDLSGTFQGAGGIGGLLARSSGYSGGSWSTHNFYHADGNGNITFLVNSSQSIAASYKYNPFGGAVSSSGSFAGANTYRFSSKEYHVNSITYYYGYRFYDPNLQRWLNRDPANEQGHRLIRSDIAKGPLPYRSEEKNLYAVLINNAVTTFDPLGLSDRGLFGARCCNTSSIPEFALIADPTDPTGNRDIWVKLKTGECTGLFDDCDGMTCKGGFYEMGGWLGGAIIGGGVCTDGKDDCVYNDRRRTPKNPGKKAIRPGRRGAPSDEPPPGYSWGE
jgi:RHS repeat-associated protein